MSMQGLEQVLQGCLSPHNQVRQQAEHQLIVAIQTQPEIAVLSLLGVLTTAQNQQVKAFIAVFLRRTLPNSEPCVFMQCSAPAQVHVKQQLLQALNGEGSRYVRGQIADTIAELSSVLLYRNEWPDLVPTLVKHSLPQNNSPIRADCVHLLALVVVKSQDHIAPDAKAGVIDLLLAALHPQNNALAVQLAAVKGSAMMLAEAVPTSETELKAPLVSFVPAMFQVFGGALTRQNANDCVGCEEEILKAIVRLAFEDASYFKPHLAAVSQLCLDFAKKPEVDQQLKHLLLQVVVGICIQRPESARKSDQFLQNTFSLCLMLMLQFDEDPNWDTTKETVQLTNSSLDYGEVALNRITAVILGRKTTPNIMPVLQHFAKNQDWRFPYAALRALAQVAEVMDKEVVFGMMPWVIQCISSGNKYLIFGAMHVIGQLSMNFAPDFQIAFKQQLVPKLGEVMEHCKVPRTQRHAAGALVNLLEGAGEEVSGQALNHILEVLQNQCFSGHMIVKEQAVNTVASLSRLMPVDHFMQIYPQFMGLFKKMLMQANGPHLVQMRIACMEAITYIGVSVGAEAFHEDAKQIIQMFVSIMNEGQLPDDDISMQYILQAWTRLCKALGKGFTQYLPLIYKFVITAADKKIEWGHKNAAEAEALLDIEAVMGADDALTLKMNAVSMLCCFAQTLQGAFFPFLPDALQVLVPMMQYYRHPGLRSAAIMAQGDLLNSAYEAMQEGKAQPQAVVEVFGLIFKVIVESLAREPVTELVVRLLKSLTFCVIILGQVDNSLVLKCLDQNNVNIIMQALMNLLAKAAKKMQARELEKKKLDFDEESQWMLEKLMEEEDELHTSVADFLDMIIGSHKQMFYPTWKQIWPAFKQMLDPKNNVLTRHTALMVMDDVIEQIGMVGVEFFKQYHDILCLYMGDADPTLRQGAAYGLGVMAGVMETKFRPLVEPTINRLVYAIENSDMKDPRSTSARDNMVVAIGRITKFANVPQLWSKWLSFLPLLHDQDEGGATYAQLCDLVEASEPNILGPQGQNRVHILGIGLHIMADEGWCGSEDVMKRIQTIVYHLITALGANTVQQLVQQNKFSQLQVHNLTAMMQHMQ